ncbi:MAG TPA: hypothetical protein DCZ01_10645 [Elusimicrobia bacterium]|nr:MAG: hypothetical protein A2X37_11775 [Elusimicrobia bacterium GWA2_66_18]HAZ08955.1 hypothetical protein [Elusimicrobiota bacterium]
MNAARRWLLVVCHFVCPLLFFTNLTRNPYVTQIALLHAGAALALAAWAWTESGRDEGWRLPRVPVALPLALFAAAWALSWLRGYFGHAQFYRPAIAAEGARSAVFLLVVCVGTFVVAAAVAADDDAGSDVSLGAWIAFALVWGLLWTAFPQARARLAARPEDFRALAWDPYGALLWALGLAGAGWLTRRGRAADFLHLAFCAGFLASAYGVLQYFNWECVWPSALNPYGGRCVSTFGNPNFLSSYNVVLMPMALALAIEERRPARRWAYAGLFLTLEAALLATLTRSSWLGAVVGCATLSLSPRLRDRAREQPRPLGLLVGAAAAMALLWPASALSTGYTPTVVGRLTEVSTFLARDGSYSPLHQRVLIWACAWLMGSEAPLLGKGGGLFELFYPFYQGHLIHEIPFFRGMRTHANNAHNEILEIFSQTGLLGLGAFVAFWVVFFWAVRRWSAGRPGRDPLWAGAASGCAGMLADNMLNVSLHFAVPAFMFWWTAGTVMGRGARQAPERLVWKAPAVLRRAAAAALVLAALAAAWLQVRFWNREAWYFAGFKLVRQNNLSAGIHALERSRSWGPREVNALYELGNAYARAARPNDAAEAYRAALDANAGYDEIFFNLATVYGGRLGRPEQALPLYETAWAINPLSADLLNGLSAAYLGDPGRHAADALALLLEGVKIFPDNPNHWNNLGYVFTLGRRWDEAQAAYEKALAISPDLALAERNLAALPGQSGRPRAPILDVLSDLRTLDAAVARRDFSERTLSLAASVARRAPTAAKARFINGSLLLLRGRAAEAIPELEAAARKEGGRAAGRVNLGKAYAALGRVAEAEKQFRLALGVEPGNASAQQALRELGPTR